MFKAEQLFARTPDDEAPKRTLSKIEELGLNRAQIPQLTQD